MNKLLIIVLITTFLISCKKEEINEEPIVTPKVLAIGVSHEGGTIFYLEPNGEHGLVATIGGPFISSGSIFDGTYIVDYQSIQWGCSGVDINGADSVSIGSGYQNTNDMLAGCPSSIASYCNEDYYLPSRDELNLIYQTINNMFSDDYYWSSSEVNNDYVMRQNFANGTMSPGLKSSNALVCLVHPF